MRIAIPKRRLPMRARRLSVLAVLLAAFLSIGSPASADVGQTIISKCTHGESLSGFSQAAYRQALQELPTEVEEYSDCGNLIRRAQLAAAGGAGGSASPGSAAPLAVTPAERTALEEVPKVAAVPLLVGNSTVRPGVIHADVASALSSLPSSLLAILALLLACALLLAGRAIRNRVRGHRAG